MQHEFHPKINGVVVDDQILPLSKYLYNESLFSLIHFLIVFFSNDKGTLSPFYPSIPYKFNWPLDLNYKILWKSIIRLQDQSVLNFEQKLMLKGYMIQNTNK